MRNRPTTRYPMRSQDGLGLRRGRADGTTVLPLVRASRAVAVAIAVGIAISSFILSFAALSDLARRSSSWGGWLPYLWPGIVDGAIVLATMGILTFSAYPDQRKAKQFFWAVLGVGTLVSVGGNAPHAILPAAAPLPTWLTFVVACVPPAGILAATHVAQSSGSSARRLRRPRCRRVVTAVSHPLMLITTGVSGGCRWPVSVDMKSCPLADMKMPTRGQ